MSLRTNHQMMRGEMAPPIRKVGGKKRTPRKTVDKRRVGPHVKKLLHEDSMSECQRSGW
jgi:hypothetical protein